MPSTELQPVARRKPASREALGTALRARFNGGVFSRELRAGLPAGLALAASALLIVALPMLVSAMRGQEIFSNAAEHLKVRLAVIFYFAQIVAGVLGVLCGAEEQENRTTEFVGQLPISRARLWREKILGSIVAVAISTTVVTLGVVLISIRLRGFVPAAAREYFSLHPVGEHLPGIILAFLWGLAAGLWIGRVLIGLAAACLAFTLASWLPAMMFDLTRGHSDPSAVANAARLHELLMFSLGLVASSLVIAAGLKLQQSCRAALPALGDLIIGTSFSPTAPPVSPTGPDIFSKRLSLARSALGSNLLLGVFLAASLMVARRIGLHMLLTHRETASSLMGLYSELYIFAAVIIGARVFSRAEHETDRFFLYVLPISRRAILREKLLVSLIPWALISLPLAPLYFERENWNILGMTSSELASFLALVLPLTGLAAILLTLTLRFYFSHVVVLLTVACLVVGSVIWCMDITDMREGISAWLFRGAAERLILIPALLAFAFFIYCRLRLAEMAPARRAALGLLVSISLIELAFTFFRGDLLDLQFLIFG